MKVLIKGDRAVETAYTEYQKFCEDKELRRIDDARQQYMHDYASDVDAAYTKGQIGSKHETIFLILTDRLGGISKQLEKKVLKITDIEKLNELVKLSAKCESMKEFEEELKK